MGRSGLIPKAGPKRVAVVSTTRADYGLLHWFIREVLADPDLELLLYVSGSHLAPEFGNTVSEIEADGVPIYRRIPIFASSDAGADAPVAATDAAGTALQEFGRALAEDSPHAVVVLGDRFEIVPVALAGVLHAVPVVHVHGGEVSAGALDEYFRHAVTKLASLHLPATEEYRRRLLQLGEPPDRVEVVGAPGLDHLYRTDLIPRRELFEALGLRTDRPTAIVTYHPVTTEPGTGLAAVEALSEALLGVDELQVLFTKANADVEGRAINDFLLDLCREHADRFALRDNLGSRTYLSCLKHFDVLVGNSSSGLIEAPAFALPVVNVGPRQDGRTRARNVIDVPITSADIGRGIAQALSPAFRAQLQGMSNPYDPYADGNVAGRMSHAIKRFLAAGASMRKEFVDLGTGAHHEEQRHRSPDRTPG